MTIADAIQFAATQLKSEGFEQPQYEARELVQALLGLDAAGLIANDGILLSSEQDQLFKEWLDKRASGVPLAYLSGRKGFYKYEFIVEPGVLVPRPETEIVVEAALARTKEKNVRGIADLGCGTGCIGLSLLGEFNEATLWCIDASIKACGVAAKNAEKLHFDERVYVINKKVEEWKPRFALDLVVANPPYIAVGDPQVQKSVHKFEPHEALYSGQEGLDAIRQWVPRVYQWLNRDGLFVCEVGAGQSEKVRVIMNESGFKQIEVSKDLSGIERVVSGIR